MDIDELLKDATLVANAAVRLGKPAGADLSRTIAAAKAQTPLTWENPAILPLQQSFANALAAISPITLNDLHAGFQPYGPRATITKVGIALLAFLAFALLYLSAALSFWQTSAAVAVASSNDGKVATRERLLNDALPLLIKLRDLGPSDVDKADPNSVLRSSLRAQMNEINLISQKIISDANALHQINRNFTFGCLILPFSSMMCPPLGSETARPAQPEASEELSAATAAGMIGLGAGVGQKNAVAGGAATQPQPAAANSSSAKPPDASPGSGPCTPMPAIKAPLDTTTASDFQTVVSAENALLLHARCAMGIVALEASISGAPNAGTASDLARRVTLFSAWLLPALYGALGSVVFHLRRLLDPTLPNPDGWRIFLRICLSSFAGISLAWFWRPDEGGNFSIASISVGSATMAFLIGYSIDAFFKLLDRIVFVANAQIDKMGGADRPPAERTG